MYNPIQKLIQECQGHKSPGTLTNYRTYATKWDSLPTGLTYAQIRDHLLSEGLSTGYVKNFFATLSKATGENLSKLVKNLKVSELKGNLYTLTRSDIEAILSAGKANRNTEKLKTMIRVACTLGIRHNEIFWLTPDNVKGDTLRYKVSKRANSTKSSWNTIYFPSELQEEAEKWMGKLKPTTYIVGSGQFKVEEKNLTPLFPFLSLDNTSKVLAKLLAACPEMQVLVTIPTEDGRHRQVRKAELITFHSFRHFKAAEMRSQGFTLDEIAQQLGDHPYTISKWYPDVHAESLVAKMKNLRP